MMDTEMLTDEAAAAEAANTTSPIASAPTTPSPDSLTDEELICFATLTNNRYDEPPKLLDYLDGLTNTWWQPNTGFQVVAVRTLVAHQLIVAHPELPAFSLTEEGHQRVAATIPLWPQEEPPHVTALVVVDDQEEVGSLV